MADEKSGATPAPQDPQGGQGNTNPNPAPAATPPKADEEKTITLKQSEYDELARKAAHAPKEQSANDARQARQNRINARKRVAEPEPEDMDKAELARAKDLITSEVLSSKDYQDLLAGNKYLARIVAQEPWKLLEQDSFVDAQDLADQVLNALDGELDAFTKPKEPASPAQPAAAEPTPAPAPNATNPGAGAAPAKTQAEKDEEALAKLPVQQRIAARIQGRVNVKK